LVLGGSVTKLTDGKKTLFKLAWFFQGNRG
jgi:hypothetical protein